MKKILALFVLCMTFAVSSAQNKNARATVEVDGVCYMCKVRIEKTAIRTKGVKSAVWNVDTHELKLIFDERKTNLEAIQENLAAVGHDTPHMKATKEAYESVDPCCRYRDPKVRDAHKN